MARFGCMCGETLSNSRVPNNIELHVFTDREWDNIIGMDTIEDTLNISDPRYDVWRCPTCERVHVFNGTKRILTYSIEEDLRKS